MKNLQALIIEDHEDAAAIFASALQAAGFECEVVPAGDKALTWLAETAPRLVLLDLQLPCVPGSEILHQIRADARLAKTHVIVATAFPDMALGLEEEADEVLFKPISFTQLRDLAKSVWGA
jgi:DNA-binding response OmpR family regulator